MGDIFKFTVQILPKGVRLCLSDQNTPFQMGINLHSRLDLYTPTGDFKELSRANIIAIRRHLKFQFSYFPKVYKPFQMQINVHARLDLYALTVDFEKFFIATIAICEMFLKLQFTYFPKVYNIAFCNKTPFQMVINVHVKLALYTSCMLLQGIL